MNSTDYRSCMTTKMGSGRLKNLTKENRRLEFCAIAKECSKNLSRDEALKVCKSQPPKPEKPESEKKERKSHKKNDCTPCIGKDVIKALYDGDSDLMDTLMEGPLKDIKKCTEPNEIKFCNI